MRNFSISKTHPTPIISFMEGSTAISIISVLHNFVFTNYTIQPQSIDSDGEIALCTDQMSRDTQPCTARGRVS